MARKRLYSPECSVHRKLWELEQESGLHIRAAWPGLWTVADRRGIFEWKPHELKLKCLPYDNDDFESVLAAFESGGFIRSYVVDGKKYAVIPTFGRWQTFHANEKPADYPGPPGAAVPHRPSIVERQPSKKSDSESLGGHEPSNGDHAPSVGVVSTPVVSTVVSTVTSAVPAAVAVSGSNSGTSPGTVDTSRLTGWPLAAAANAAIELRWGLQQQKLMPNAVMLESYQGHGINIAFAMRCIYEYALTAKLDAPPTSIRFFDEHVKERWRVGSKIGQVRPSRVKTPRGTPVTEFERECVQHARSGSLLFREFCDQMDWSWQREDPGSLEESPTAANATENNSPEEPARETPQPPVRSSEAIAGPTLYREPPAKNVSSIGDLFCTKCRTSVMGQPGLVCYRCQQQAQASREVAV